MSKSMFTIKGNLCSERVRLGRALQKPPITQEELAKKLPFMGMEDMTPLIISRIEKNQRHVCDGERWRFLWNGCWETVMGCSLCFIFLRRDLENA